MGQGIFRGQGMFIFRSLDSGGIEYLGGNGQWTDDWRKAKAFPPDEAKVVAKERGGFTCQSVTPAPKRSNNKAKKIRFS